MISELKNICEYVQLQIPDFRYIHWNSYEQIKDYPAFVLDSAKKRCERIGQGNTLYEATMEVEGYILAKVTGITDMDFENLVDRTVYALLKSDYKEVRLNNYSISKVQISNNQCYAFWFNLEMTRIEEWTN